ncbi:MAG: hypothetical protein RL328_239 [Acidobacteriota bacterium]|jgi:hypothetical protein
MRAPRSLRRLLTHNLGWKFVCLALAILLWVLLVGQRPA